jgi:sulfur relay (sulfurtransferase) DsrC/TusE family protein
MSKLTNSRKSQPITPLPADVFLQTISDASIKMIESEPKVINIIHDEDWRALVMVYLRHYYEHARTAEQTRMQQRAQLYQIVNNELYKISISDSSSTVSAKPKVIKYCRSSMQECAEVISKLEH